MRSLLVVALVLSAGSALAQDESADRAAARAMMIEELGGQGLSEAMADGAASCALERMSDDEVTSLITATDDAAREAVIDGISDQDGLVTCMSEVVSQG